MWKYQNVKPKLTAVGLLRVTRRGAAYQSDRLPCTDTKSLKGGVTLVQVREKEVDTGEVSVVLPHSPDQATDQQFIEVARRTKDICDKVSRPMMRRCRRGRKI
jgi:thiamine monophosphate synthase